MSGQDLRADAFARLDEAQMAALDRCLLTKSKRYRDGEKLFEVGDRDSKFFVVKSGAVENYLGFPTGIFGVAGIRPRVCAARALEAGPGGC